jgi:hypothetical protein
VYLLITTKSLVLTLATFAQLKEILNLKPVEAVLRPLKTLLSADLTRGKERLPHMESSKLSGNRSSGPQSLTLITRLSGTCGNNIVPNQ